MRMRCRWTLEKCKLVFFFGVGWGWERMASMHCIAVRHERETSSYVNANAIPFYCMKCIDCNLNAIKLNSIVWINLNRFECTRHSIMFDASYYYYSLSDAIHADCWKLLGWRRARCGCGCGLVNDRQDDTFCKNETWKIHFEYLQLTKHFPPVTLYAIWEIYERVYVGLMAVAGNGEMYSNEHIFQMLVTVYSLSTQSLLCWQQ